MLLYVKNPAMNSGEVKKSEDAQTCGLNVKAHKLVYSSQGMDYSSI